MLVVTIDDPSTKGSYFGGSTAAPLTKRMLEQALASRYIAMDRDRLGGSHGGGGGPARPRRRAEAQIAVRLGDASDLAVSPARLAPRPGAGGQRPRRERARSARGGAGGAPARASARA